WCEHTVVRQMLDDLRRDDGVDGLVRQLLDVRDVGDDPAHLRRQPFAQRYVLRRDVDRMDRLADEARMVERPQGPAVARAEVREHARRRSLRGPPQQRRHPLVEEVPRLFEVPGARPRRAHPEEPNACRRARSRSGSTRWPSRWTYPSLPPTTRSTSSSV